MTPSGGRLDPSYWPGPRRAVGEIIALTYGWTPVTSDGFGLAAVPSLTRLSRYASTVEVCRNRVFPRNFAPLPHSRRSCGSLSPSVPVNKSSHSVRREGNYCLHSGCAFCANSLHFQSLAALIASGPTTLRIPAKCMQTDAACTAIAPLYAEGFLLPKGKVVPQGITPSRVA